MPQEPFDFVIPLYRQRWNTRAVLEGLTLHYQPRAIHIITPEPEVAALRSQSSHWQVAPLDIHAEEPFFQPQGLDKETICAELDLGESLYTPGWFYQQLLKLGAAAGIPTLSEWYMVWDSDLLPVATWPLVTQQAAGSQHAFALLQHNQWGNASIVAKWDRWIREVLGVEPLTDVEGTFVPHHMWFKQAHLQTFQQQVGRYFQSDDHWLLLMMRSANQFGTFSEYWAYVSWVAAQSPADLCFYPYAEYGTTTERFFDDGTAVFSAALRQCLAIASPDGFSPAYTEVDAFIRAEYGAEALPSSLAFESSPRHLKKGKENMHIEEQRSRWHPLNQS
ncbi:MAG: hypothetical protein HC838_07610 [Spirulinaceae cyanobacterium RM2_2_10]|nr:hypothetical protein [Spirulinaceae cyanobacterium SM2_1_0]NJO19947.1 hypothetical protein [Spirulinaceae cyanobacterium RM2_2_10]